MPGTAGKSANLENSLPLGLGTGAERPWSAPFKASSFQRALNSLPLVSSDTLTLLVCYVHELRSRNLKDCTNVLHNLKQSRDWHAVSGCAVQSRDCAYS